VLYRMVIFSMTFTDS